MWRNKKYGKKLFKGFYVRLKGERVFNLQCENKVVTFESWQAAKRLGWSRS